MTEAEKERAAVVRYLRGRIPRSQPVMDPTWTAAFNCGIDYCAKAIERSDHLKEGRARCSLDVGCDEAGACYAVAHGKPEMCPCEHLKEGR